MTRGFSLVLLLLCLFGASARADSVAVSFPSLDGQGTKPPTRLTARLLLPDGLTGLLAVRSRRTDVGVLVAFGIGLLVMGLVLPR